jgi:hypothetical protein
LHVSRFLPRLLGWPEPYTEVKEFQADLAATRDRPTEVQRWRRAAHLGLLGVVLFLGWWLLILPVYESPRVRYVALVGRTIRGTESTLEALNREASLALAVNLVNPDSAARLQGLALWRHDLTLRDRLQQRQSALRKEHAAWRGTLSGPHRVAAFLRGTLPTHVPEGESRSRAEHLLDTDVRAEALEDGAEVIIVALGVWVALWVVWAFLTRGGVGYRLVDIRLVRTDGRKAARWQCAVRSLLFWLPVFGLLVAAYCLDYGFWSLGDPQVGGLPGWLPLLALMAWLAGLLLLPGYAVLALRSPARSLHDRLAGTFLTPR